VWLALPEKTIKVAWQLARRSKADPLEREKALAELLWTCYGLRNAFGYVSVDRRPVSSSSQDINP
jgi:hypothetical protein